MKTDTKAINKKIPDVGDFLLIKSIIILNALTNFYKISYGFVINAVPNGFTITLRCNKTTTPQNSQMLGCY